MNVLSLFDGMSCGQIALERAGIKVDNYYASEIDKYAIKVTQKNYPNTIQLGDVTTIEVDDLPKIDLLIGGSPCQGFSFAGKQLNFDDPRSKLFFEYVRILNELKIKNTNVNFLLENVVMRQEYQDIITENLGIKPIKINSNLVSAQNRERLYWTNIDFNLPIFKNVVLKDIVQLNGEFKIQEFRPNGRTIFSKNGLLMVGEAHIKGNENIRRVYDIKGKCPTLTTMGGGHREPKIAINEKEWRKLTPLECERLQTVPDNYTEGVSNSQRYKMLGNGWTVDVIANIFKNFKQS